MRRKARMGATPEGKLDHNAREARQAFEAAVRAVGTGKCGEAVSRFGDGSRLLGRAHAAAEDLPFGAASRLTPAMEASAEAEGIVRSACVRDTAEPKKKQGSLFGVRRR